MSSGYGDHRIDGLDAPAWDAADVTPSDSADLPRPARSLYVGGAGDVSVITRGGSTVTFTAVPAGMVLPVQVRRVRATGTTATSIDALF